MRDAAGRVGRRDRAPETDNETIPQDEAAPRTPGERTRPASGGEKPRSARGEP